MKSASGSTIWTMTEDAPTSPDQAWFTVKCLFSHPSRVDDAVRFLYEERTTLWRTSSFKKAIELAEVEAAAYATEANCLFVRATDSYQLFDETIGQGSEIYSIMRDSGMEPEVYADTFCCTPRDHAGFLDEDSPTP